MGQVKVTFSGGVVAAPERKNLGGADALQFPVYVNHTKKNKDTGEYDKTGDTTKIRVTLWRDLANEDIQQGDIVEIEGTLVEKEFQKQDGSTGRALQTEYVNSIVVKHRGGGNQGSGSGGQRGFGGGGSPSASKGF